MTTYSTILAWRIPWTEAPGGLQSMGSQRVGHDSVTKAFTFPSSEQLKMRLNQVMMTLKKYLDTGADF